MALAADESCYSLRYHYDDIAAALPYLPQCSPKHDANGYNRGVPYRYACLGPAFAQISRRLRALFESRIIVLKRRRYDTFQEYVRLGPRRTLARSVSCACLVFSGLSFGKISLSAVSASAISCAPCVVWRSGATLDTGNRMIGILCNQ